MSAAGWLNHPGAEEGGSTLWPLQGPSGCMVYVYLDRRPSPNSCAGGRAAMALGITHSEAVQKPMTIVHPESKTVGDHNRYVTNTESIHNRWRRMCRPGPFLSQ